MECSTPGSGAQQPRPQEEQQEAELRFDSGLWRIAAKTPGVAARGGTAVATLGSGAQQPRPQAEQVGRVKTSKQMRPVRGAAVGDKSSGLPLVDVAQCVELLELSCMM